MKRKKILNSLKIFGNDSAHKLIRSSCLLFFKKKKKFKKIQNFKKFSRIANIAKFFFKCNSEFFNYKYQLVSLNFFFHFKKLILLDENFFFKINFTKYFLKLILFFNVSKYLSRINFFNYQLENNNAHAIFLKNQKWSLFINNFYSFFFKLNDKFISIPLLNIWKLKILLTYYYYNLVEPTKLKLIIQNSKKNNFFMLYKLHFCYICVI